MRRYKKSDVVTCLYYYNSSKQNGYSPMRVEFYTPVIAPSN